MNNINSKQVKEMVLADTLEFIEPEDYNVSTKKEVLQKMIESVTYDGNKFSLHRQVHDLVFGGVFRIYSHDIIEFMETLNLKESTMKKVEKEPMLLYSDAVYHAIKGYLKD